MPAGSSSPLFPPVFYSHDFVPGLFQDASFFSSSLDCGILETLDSRLLFLKEALDSRHTFLSAMVDKGSKPYSARWYDTEQKKTAVLFQEQRS